MIGQLVWLSEIYYQYVTVEGMPHEEMMRYIHRRSRDNARTPMQWTAGENAGFTTGTPWFLLNPNYTKINAAAQVDDPDSVFAYYKRLIRLRKENPVMVYGKYELLLPEDKDLYVYTRTDEDTQLYVVCRWGARYSCGAGSKVIPPWSWQLSTTDQQSMKNPSAI